MKILHIAHDRDAAMAAARMVHGIARNVALTWARTPADALHWLQGNPDAAAVIIDPEERSCASFLDEVRSLGMTPPTVVVAGPARLEPMLAGVGERERRRQQTLTQTLTELAAIEQQLARAEEARRQAEQRCASGIATAAATLADVRAQHSASLARETKIGMALQQRLLELETAVRRADERRASEAVAFADQLAKRHTEFTANLAQAAQARDVLAAELSVATAALGEEHQARRADAAAAAEHLRRRDAELRADLAEAIAGRTVLEHALAEAEAAHQESRQRAATDLDEANERQAALEDLLAQETDRRTTLERRLTAAETALQQADRWQAAESARAATTLAELQARFDAALEENALVRDALERQTADAAVAMAALEQRLAEAQSAAQYAKERATADLASAASREAALDDRLARETERAIALERQLAAAETAQQDIVHRSRVESEARAAIEQELAGVRGRSARQRRRSLRVVAAYRERVREQTSRLEAQLATERADTERELGARDEELRQSQLDYESLRHLQTTSESELQRVSAEYGQIRESFDLLQSAFQTLEQVAGDHAAERARLEKVVAARESQLNAQTERHRIAEQQAEGARAELQEKLRQTLETGDREMARLQHEIESVRRELETTRSHAEALRGVAQRVPDLQTQLERSRGETRRQFERAPYALCRCSPSGAIIDANHSFVTLLGCRRAGELANVDFVTAALDSAGDLSWLIERARTTRKTETVETHWKTRDGRRLVVRLQALVNTTGAIDLVAEDITSVRALEERLRQAQRLEAVGRLASEVAVTCHALLSDVARGADEWVAGIGSDATARRHAERLLTDVKRAAGFLRQLGTYGNEQVRALDEPVSAQRVLRDLAPVLKRLVGEQIDLVLPKAGGAFPVDVDAERLERIFINVAGYARERMPSGGQVSIDLATTAVGRRFAAKYSNVRPGEHVLVTVTELPSTRELQTGGDTRARSTDRPGVDLGVLVDLIASGGGHLWLEAQPAGNMVVKIHLPKPPAANLTDNRSGRLSRWFRSAATTKVRA